MSVRTRARVVVRPLLVHRRCVGVLHHDGSPRLLSLKSKVPFGNKYEKTVCTCMCVRVQLGMCVSVVVSMSVCMYTYVFV